jgi:hypothetical protein
MSQVNLLSRMRGAASIHYIGQDFWTNDVAAFDIAIAPFKVKSDAFGTLSNRAGGRLITATFTPVGVWTAAQLAILFPFLNPRLGDFNTPIRPVSGANTGAGTLTVTNHGYLTGTGVRAGAVGVGSALPGGIAANTTCYVVAVDANTISLADTEAHALAGTNLIELTSAGSGTIRLIQNTPLIITTVDGLQLTVWNAALVDMPALSLAPLNSTMKQVKFEGYTLHGQDWSDANSLYTCATGVIGAVPPIQSQIPTVSYDIDWATRLAVTEVSDGTGALTVPNHGLATAEAVTADFLSANGALPAPLAVNTVYYAIVVDANNVKLATSSGNANSGTAIALTSTGEGEINLVSPLQLEGLQPRDAIDVTFQATWDPVKGGGGDINCRSLTDVEAKAEFVPTNLDLGSMLTTLALQGGSAALGMALGFANLDIYGPGENPFIRIYGASPRPKQAGPDEPCKSSSMARPSRRSSRKGASTR